MAGPGITFGVAKLALAKVVDNGTCSDDVRIMDRCNEATQRILDELIPVGGMSTYDVVASGTTLLLPKQLENAIEVTVLSGATVNGSTDVTQGWYDLVNQFTYVDPSMAFDNPLVDQFLVPDGTDPTILRRQYDYPGLAPNSTVRVTGAKRYIPITQDGDPLIVQNVPALKLMILSIERYENNDLDGSEKYRQLSLGLCHAEVKKHQLDPRNSLKRKAGYQADLVNYQEGSFGRFRARIALEVPGGMMMGKSDLTYLLGHAEMRLLEKGMWKGSLEQFFATIVGGDVLFPVRVESLLTADICGEPTDIRSIFFEYQKNGPGKFRKCEQMFTDKGEVFFSDTGTRRRRYRYHGDCTTNVTMTCVCKLKWIEKTPTDQMTIRNYEAIRLMSQAIMMERQEKWQEAQMNQSAAIDSLQHELNEYLGGEQAVPHIDWGSFGMGHLGGVQ